MVIKKLLKFASVGAIGSVSNISIFSFLVYLDINYNIASVVAFLFAVTQNYTLNKKWTFKDHNTQTKQKFLKYFILNLSSFLVNLAVLNLVVINFDEGTLTKVIGQILGIGVAMGFNFIGSYLVVFAKEKETKEEN